MCVLCIAPAGCPAGPDASYTQTRARAHTHTHIGFIECRAGKRSDSLRQSDSRASRRRRAREKTDWHLKLPRLRLEVYISTDCHVLVTEESATVELGPTTMANAVSHPQAFMRVAAFVDIKRSTHRHNRFCIQTLPALRAFLFTRSPAIIVTPVKEPVGAKFASRRAFCTHVANAIALPTVALRHSLLDPPFFFALCTRTFLPKQCCQYKFERALLVHVSSSASFTPLKRRINDAWDNRSLLECQRN